MKNEIKSIIGWGAFVIMAFFTLFCGWDYMTTKLENYERRIAALETKFETEARPLIIVDKYSSVYLNGKEVKPENIDADL